MLAKIVSTYYWSSQCDVDFISVIKHFTISDWLFSSTFIQVSNSNLTQNITAICAGDVEAADKF